MKVTAFCGSPRKDGNTMDLLETVCAVLEKEGIETEIINIYESDLVGCRACDRCYVNKDNKCVFAKDKLNDYVQKMIESDGIIIGSPVYFANVTTNVKSLIDRGGRVSRANNNLLKYKVGAGVVAVRRAGALPALDAINYFYLANQVIIPGSSYWNLAMGKSRGEVTEDDEGIKTMNDLGRNMAFLLKKVRS